MDGKEIVEHLYSFKARPTIEHPDIKVKGAENLQVFQCDTRNLFQRIAHKPLPNWYVAWFEPKELVPFLWGYLAFNFDGKGWSKPKPITRSMVMGAGFA